MNVIELAEIKRTLHANPGMDEWTISYRDNPPWPLRRYNLLTPDGTMARIVWNNPQRQEQWCYNIRNQAGNWENGYSGYNAPESAMRTLIRQLLRTQRDR